MEMKQELQKQLEANKADLEEQKRTNLINQQEYEKKMEEMNKKAAGDAEHLRREVDRVKENAYKGAKQGVFTAIGHTLDNACVIS